MRSEAARVRELCSGYLEEYLGKVRFCLERLDEAQVWWRPHRAGNSVGNLVLHVCGNLSQWVLSGLGGEADSRRRALEFAADRPMGKRRLAERLSSVVARCRRRIALLDEEALAAPRTIQHRRTDGLGALLHAVEHMSYHTGQIVFVAKQLRGEGSGIDFYPHLNAPPTTRPPAARRPPRATRARPFKAGRPASGRRRGRR
ncbi:MAG: hypothetical protein DMF80_14760 [Acidobacteria bacterium]|nr:MAG: hypothetical protein DMF80_14760 [Acidobacteriota bacterium]